MKKMNRTALAVLVTASLLVHGTAVQAQSVRPACASALHDAAFTNGYAGRIQALDRFDKAGCKKDITDAFGTAGIPPLAGTSPMALMALGYAAVHGTLRAEKEATVAKSGPSQNPHSNRFTHGGEGRFQIREEILSDR